MKKPKQPTRNWVDLFKLCPLGPTALAEALGTTRQSLHALQHGDHARVPIPMLGKLAEVLKAQGMADGSPAPTREELVRSWRDSFDGTQGLRQLMSGGDL